MSKHDFHANLFAEFESERAVGHHGRSGTGAGGWPPARCKLPGGFSPEATSQLRMTKHPTAARLNTCVLRVAPSSIFQTSAIKLCFLSFLSGQ